MIDARRILVDRTKMVLKTLLPHECDHICLVDAPDHSNVGDQAILLGEMNWIKDHSPNAKISFFDTSNYGYEAESILNSADVILLHGGGNFGTTWPHHHQLRLRILERFNDKIIIQLPQTISFSDPAAVAATEWAIRRNKHFNLLVRDQESLQFAQRVFTCATTLTPDMAFFLDLQPKRQEIKHILCLLRTDKETVLIHQEVESIVRATGRSFMIDDWLTNPRTFSGLIDRRLQTLRRRIPRLTNAIMPMHVASRLAYAEKRLEFGCRLLNSAKLIISDRLHAHILCCIMGLKHVVLDSFDQKVSRFHQTWSAGFANSYLANNVSDLPKLLKNL